MHQQPPKTPLFASTSPANASQLDSSRALIVYPDPTSTQPSPPGRMALGCGGVLYPDRVGPRPLEAGIMRSIDLCTTPAKVADAREGRAMSMFDTFDRTGTVEFPFAPPVVFRAVEVAVPKLKGMKVAESNAVAGHLYIKTGASAFSWGEKVQ